MLRFSQNEYRLLSVIFSAVYIHTSDLDVDTDQIKKKKRDIKGVQRLRALDFGSRSGSRILHPKLF